jgi:hypothetical protein
MKLPKPFRKKGRGGRYTGNWRAKVDGDEVNLGTTDAVAARARLIAAVKHGKRNFVDELDETAAAMELAEQQAVAAATDEVSEREMVSGSAGAAPAPAPVPGSTPGAPPAAAPASSPPAAAPDPVAEAAATAAAAAETVESSLAAAEPANDNANTEPTAEELADLGVKLQVWGAEVYAQHKVYKGFVAPPLPTDAKAELAAQWRKIIEYSGASRALPPWVTGLVIPAASLAIASFGMAQGFAQLAEQQRQAGGAPAAPAAPGNPSGSGESAAA